MPPDAHRLTLAPPAAAGAHERSRAQRSRSTSALFGGYEYVYKDLRRILVLVITALVLLIVVSFTLPHLSF
ncbi:MAG: hypothetical protein M1296_05150 [Chloroflexi bacterium]|nr:hypothetical protein [Chloroflexota bacterium]